jgi:putative hydrolase of the HAD superfamily
MVDEATGTPRGRAGPGTAPARPRGPVWDPALGGIALGLRAIVFDLDGTIVDTETPWYTAAGELYARHGLRLEFADWARGIGTASTAFDPLTHLERLLGHPIDREALAAQYRGRVEALLADAALRPGVRELLDAAEARGLALALASSSSRPWVLARLAPFGLLPRFAAVCTREDVMAVKPDPALYRLAVDRLGVSPAEALAIEDSPHGATAALRAGLACVVVPNPTTAPLPVPTGARRLDSLAELDLDKLTTGAGVRKVDGSVQGEAPGEGS